MTIGMLRTAEGAFLPHVVADGLVAVAGQQTQLRRGPCYLIYLTPPVGAKWCAERAPSKAGLLTNITPRALNNRRYTHSALPSSQSKLTLAFWALGPCRIYPLSWVHTTRLVQRGGLRRARALMDFTSTYACASWDSVSFSPGSTFLAYVSGSSRRHVIVRVVGTLQVVRSWELDGALDALEWSMDGLYLLASTYTKSTSASPQGVSYVLPLDPDLAVTDGSDDGRGWVARIASVQGVERATWLPVKRVPAVIQFFPFGTGAVIYSLADQAFTLLPNTPLASVFVIPEWPEHFAILQREKETDTLCVYTPHESHKPTIEEPVHWDLYRSFGVHTSHLQHAAFSPDGHYVAAWDHTLDYKLVVCTVHGAAQVMLTMDEDDVPRTSVPLTAVECRKALTQTRDTGHARRVSVRASRSQSHLRRVSNEHVNRTGRKMGVALGVSTVAWHPSSEFLAVGGGLDECIYVLAQHDWSLAYSLDLSAAALHRMHDLQYVWVEPYRWFEATAGRGIVPMELTSLHTALAEVITQHETKTGACWIAWNADGSVLACQNKYTPNVMLLYEFFGLHERSVDAHLRPLAVIVLSAPITSAAWQPEHACSLALTTGQSSVYSWTQKAGEDAVQCCEAVAIPNDKFHSMHMTYSPDGNTMLLADMRAFCCAVSAPVDEEATEQKLEKK